MSEDEYEPASREQLETMAAASRDYARGIRAQYEAYVEAGFDEAQALELVKQWMVISA